jgi:hypothetical protein
MMHLKGNTVSLNLLIANINHTQKCMFVDLHCNVTE